MNDSKVTEAMENKQGRVEGEGVGTEGRLLGEFGESSPVRVATPSWIKRPDPKNTPRCNS